MEPSSGTQEESDLPPPSRYSLLSIRASHTSFLPYHAIVSAKSLLELH
jgi:hypothetical protein